MTRNKLISSLVIAGVLAASVSTAAFADDHRGRNNNGTATAIAVGVLGAVVIGSLLANSQPAYAAPQPYYPPQPAPVYQAAPAYYQPPPPPVQQTYYAQPQPYYAPQPVTVIEERYGARHEYRDYRRNAPYGYYTR